MPDIRVEVFEIAKPKSVADELQAFLDQIVGEGRSIVSFAPFEITERAVGSRLKRVHSYVVISDGP